MDKLISLADYGPIGFIIIAIILVLKLVLDYYKSVKVDEKILSDLAKISANQKVIEKKVKEMHEWHNVHDVDGVKLWHRKNSLDERMILALDNLAVATDKLSDLQRENSFALETIKEKINDRRRSP